MMFQEVNYDKVDKVKGLNVSIITSAATDAEAKSMLKHLGMPFRKTSSDQQNQEDVAA